MTGVGTRHVRDGGGYSRIVIPGEHLLEQAADECLEAVWRGEGLLEHGLRGRAELAAIDQDNASPVAGARKAASTTTRHPTL